MQIFRPIIAVFVRDEGEFFTSTDVQRLNIGVMLTPGDLVPDKVVLHDHRKLSISINPETCLQLLPEFFSSFQSDTPEDAQGLVFEIWVKNPEYWQTKIKFLLDKSQVDDLEKWLAASGHFSVRKEDCVKKFCLPDKEGPAWKRMKEGFSDQRGMIFMDQVKKEFCDLPSLEHSLHKFAFSSFDVPTDCQVPNTLEIFGFPLPPANQLVIEMVLNAMMQTTDYQEYVKDSKVFRDIEPSDLPCTMLSSLSQSFTPS